MKNVNRKTSKSWFYLLLGLIVLRPSLDIFSQQEFQPYSQFPPISLNIIFGGLIFLIGFVFLIKNLKHVFKIHLFYPISAFLGLIFFSIFYSSDPVISTREFIRLSSIFFLYFTAYLTIKHRDDFKLLLKFILASYILPGGIALSQLFFGQGLLDQFGGFERIYGTFAHPNLFAFYTFFIFGLMLCLALKKKTNNTHLWLAVAVITFLLLATYTRSAMACLAIFIILFGIFKYKKLLLAGSILFLGLYLFSDIFQQRLWELISLDPYGSVVWRFRLWQDIIPISLWHPWLGRGAGTFSSLVEYYRGFSFGSLDAHNDYLKIFVENGLAGLAAYVWLIIYLVIYLFKIFKKAVTNDKVLALGILMISISLFAASFFDNILRTTALQWNFWILIAAWLKIKKP